MSDILQDLYTNTEYLTALMPLAGLTKRDWFAGQLLAAIYMGNHTMTCEAIAKECYQMADAMIKEGMNDQHALSTP